MPSSPGAMPFIGIENSEDVVLGIMLAEVYDPWLYKSETSSVLAVSMSTRLEVLKDWLSPWKASEVGTRPMALLGVVTALMAMLCATPPLRCLLAGEAVAVALALCSVLVSPLPLLLASVLFSGLSEACVVDFRELFVH